MQPKFPGLSFQHAFPSTYGHKLFSGSRLECSIATQISKASPGITCNTFKAKILQGSSIIISKLDCNCYHVIAMALATVKYLVLGFSFCWCHKLHKPSPSGHVTTYILFPTPVLIASSFSFEEKHGLYLCQEGGKKMDKQLHLVKLWGVRFFFIPSDGGSRKHVSPSISIFA